MDKQAVSSNDIWRRVKTFKETGTEELVLGPGALLEAAELLLRAFPLSGSWLSELRDSDLNSVRAVMGLHAARYQALTQSQNRLDRETIIALLALVHHSHPQAVPEVFRSRVNEHAQRHAGISLLAAAALTAQAKTMYALFQATGNLAILDATIAARKRAADLTPAAHPYRAAYLSNLSGTLQQRFQQIGTIADLMAGVKAAESTVATASPDDPSYATIMSTAGTAFAISFQHSGDLADLNEAISAFRKAADTLPGESRASGPILSNLSGALRLRFDRLGSISDLEEAIDTGRSALSSMQQSHPQHSTCQYNLGGALASRYATHGGTFCQGAR